MPSELELKLAIDPQDVEDFFAVTQALGWSIEAEQQLNNTYFDTPDEALKRERVALRVRQAGERWIQTLKTAGTVDSNGISVRGEWEWELPGPDLVAELATEHLPANIDAAQLAARFTTDFKRTTWLVSEAGSVIEVALDRGEIRAAGRQLPISEVELELKSGEPDQLLRLAEKLKQRVALRVETGSKAQRAQALINGDL